MFSFLIICFRNIRVLVSSEFSHGVVVVESLLPVVAPQKSHERETASSRREDDKNTRYSSKSSSGAVIFSACTHSLRKALMGERRVGALMATCYACACIHSTQIRHNNLSSMYTLSL